MTDALSIFAAAREAPRSTALKHGAQAFSFSQLADLTRDRLRALQAELRPATPFPLTGVNTLEVVVSLYALLEQRAPVLLLHPRLTAAEREFETQAAARHYLSGQPDVAAILYTSGTTGRPRGAVLTRSALVASARASATNLGWYDDDCWLLAMPLGRIGGLSIVTRCLAARKTVALEPACDAATLPARIDATRSTLVSVVPTMLAQALDAHPDWMAPAHLRAILVGGAAAPAGLLQCSAQRRLPIVITYGCTETCSQIVATPYAKRYEAAACGAGRPLTGAELRILGGHIQARGPMLMAGYLGEPPLPAGDWFDTGDLGSLDEQGCVHIHARRADLVVTGGENVYPAEVEHTLAKCPGIREAGVFGVQDEIWGQTVAAALVATQLPPDDATLMSYLSERLAPYKRPRQICFVPSLPHTPAGKLDRDALQGFAPCLRPLRAAVTAAT
jgi:O-succinylbenzoic acid--CoA ligase